MGPPGTSGRIRAVALQLVAFTVLLAGAVGAVQPGYVGCFTIESQTDVQVFAASRDVDAGASCQRSCDKRGALYFGLRDFGEVAGTICGCFNSLTPYTLDILGGEPTDDKYCKRECPLSAFNCACGHINGVEVKHFAIYSIEEVGNSVLYPEVVKIIDYARRQAEGMENPSDKQLAFDLAHEALLNMGLPVFDFDVSAFVGTSLGNLVDVTKITSNSVHAAKSIIVNDNGERDGYYDTCTRIANQSSNDYNSMEFSSTEEYLEFKSAEASIASRFAGFSTEINGKYTSDISGTRTIAVGYYKESHGDVANGVASIFEDCHLNPSYYSTAWQNYLRALPSYAPVTSDLDDPLYPAYKIFFETYGTHQVRQVFRGLSIEVLVTDVEDDVVTKSYFKAGAEAGFKRLVGAEGEVSYETMDDYASAERQTQIFINGGDPELAAKLVADFNDRRGGNLAYERLLSSAMNSANANIMSISVVPVVVLASNLFGMPESPSFPTNGSQILINLDLALERYTKEAAFKTYCKSANWDQASYTCLKTLLTKMTGLPAHFTLGTGFPLSNGPIFSFQSRSPTNAGRFTLCGHELYGRRDIPDIIARKREECHLGGGDTDGDLEDPPFFYGTKWSFAVLGLDDYPGAFFAPPYGSAAMSGNIDLVEAHCIYTDEGNNVYFGPFNAPSCTFVHIVDFPDPAIPNNLAIRVGVPKPEEESVHYLMTDAFGQLIVTGPHNSTSPLSMQGLLRVSFERVRVGDKSWGKEQWYGCKQGDCTLCGNANAYGISERCNALVRRPEEVGYPQEDDCGPLGHRVMCEVAPNWFDFGQTY